MGVESVVQENTTSNLRRRAVRQGAVFLVARLFMQVLQWMVTLIVARLLHAEDYGLMTSAVVFVGLAEMLAEAGVNRALIQKAEMTPDDLAQGFTLSLGLATFFYVLLFILAGPVGAYLERADFPDFLRLLSLVLFFTPFEAVSGAILERDLHMGKRSGVLMVGFFAQAVLVLAMAYYGWGYWALGAGALANSFFRTISCWYVSGWRLRLAWPKREGWHLFRYGMQISIASLLWFFYSNADFAILGALLGPVALGYYALAFQLISLPVQKVSANVNQVVFPVFCKIQHERVLVQDYFLRLAGLVTCIALPALVGLALVADDALPLVLGRQWEPAILPLQLLCPVGALMMINSPVPVLLVALGRPDLNLKYTVAGALLYPAGFLLGGWCAGVFGVCIVWLILYPVMMASLLHLSRKVTGIDIPDMLRAQLPILIGVSFMTIWVLAVQTLMIDMFPWFRLGACIAAGAVSYSVWMLIFTRKTIVKDFRVLWNSLRSKEKKLAEENIREGTETCPDMLTEGGREIQESLP